MLPKKDIYEIDIKSDAEGRKALKSGAVSEAGCLADDSIVECSNSRYDPDQSSVAAHDFAFVEIKSFNFDNNAQYVGEGANVGNLNSENKEDKSRTCTYEVDSSSSEEQSKKSSSQSAKPIHKKKKAVKRKRKSSIKIVFKEKPHECKICEKRFSTTPQLSRHMNSHTGNRPYKCKYCDARFGDPSTKIKHERIHTNEKPYKCLLCNKAFAYSNVLKSHMMTHTGEKPHSCDYCEKRFSQLHHKTAHEKRHTNIHKVILENPPDVSLIGEDDLEDNQIENT